MDQRKLREYAATSAVAYLCGAMITSTGAVPSVNERARKAVATWILIGVGMLLVQVVLGGITRLTGSGLSITEWNVVTGTLPPLSEAQWLEEFRKYQQTPQFQLLNIDFTLPDFKFIFFWEWFHRFWARLIGVVFIVGFVYLTSKKYLKEDMSRPLLILFVLGAMQGAVGWIMVASGLTGDAVYVKPTRLAMHFIFAMVLIAYAYWFYMKLSVARTELVIAPRARKFTWWLLALIAIQLVFGALMAGHKAATAAPTWPDINGQMLPSSLFADTPWLLNFIENKITIHFVHRTLAYLLLALFILYAISLSRISKSATLIKRYRITLVILVLVQVALGVFAVLTSPQIVPNHWGVFEWLAQLHQVAGMTLMLGLVGTLYLVRRS